MPDERQRKAFEAELRRSRRDFFGRLASDAGSAAKRLERAYAGSLGDIKRTISAFDRWVAKDADYALLYAQMDMRDLIAADLSDLQAALVDASAEAQAKGAAQGVRMGAEALQRGGVNLSFFVPTIETIQAGIGYVDAPAWRSAVGRLADYHAQQAADMVLSAVAAGVNPRTTATMLREYFVISQRPMVDALRIARTTQLYAAREGTRQIYERAGIQEWVWSAAIDAPNTCIACIALHGTVHPVTEVLSDHHMGRCAPVPVTPTWEAIGLTGVADPGAAEFETGVAWFERQSDAVQMARMGPEFWSAWKAGAFELRDIPRRSDNPIFGAMWRKATLGELTGGASSAARRIAY